MNKKEIPEERDPEFLLRAFVKGELDAADVGYEDFTYPKVVEALETEIDSKG